MQSDSHYIQEILTGKVDEAVFSLVRKHEKKIFNLCFRIIRNRETAEEVAQDAFLKSFRDLKKLKDPSKYEIWLNRIAYRMCIDVTRKKKRFYSDINDTDPSQLKPVETITLDEADRKEVIEQVLKEIPIEDAALITLYYLNEMQVKEVAEIMKMSISNVKVKLLRTRNELKEKLNRRFGDEVQELY